MYESTYDSLSTVVVCTRAILSLALNDDVKNVGPEELRLEWVFVGDMILAAVDMGTNSFHMVVVRADKQGRFQLMDTEKEDVRLGSGSPDLSVITPDAENRALAALKRFKILAQTRKAEIRVVATSAVREARNRRTFVRRVRDSVGLEVEVLAGTEEACLIYQGVLQALPVYNKTVLVVDIGGGSTEFVLGNSGKPIYATSLKLGHIRLSEQYLSLGSRKEELKKEQVSVNFCWLSLLTILALLLSILQVLFYCFNVVHITYFMYTVDLLLLDLEL